MDIIDRIMRATDGELLCIIQAASEMPASYSVEEKLEAGYAEVIN